MWIIPKSLLFIVCSKTQESTVNLGCCGGLPGGGEMEPDLENQVESSRTELVISGYTAWPFLSQFIKKRILTFLTTPTS